MVFSLRRGKMVSSLRREKMVFSLRRGKMVFSLRREKTVFSPRRGKEFISLRREKWFTSLRRGKGLGPPHLGKTTVSANRGQRGLGTWPKPARGEHLVITGQAAKLLSWRTERVVGHAVCGGLAPRQRLSLIRVSSLIVYQCPTQRQGGIHRRWSRRGRNWGGSQSRRGLMT